VETELAPVYRRTNRVRSRHLWSGLPHEFRTERVLNVLDCTELMRLGIVPAMTILEYGSSSPQPADSLRSPNHRPQFLPSSWLRVDANSFPRYGGFCRRDGAVGDGGSAGTTPAEEVEGVCQAMRRACSPRGFLSSTTILLALLHASVIQQKRLPNEIYHKDPEEVATSRAFIFISNILNNTWSRP